jgi:predicted Zn-dependent protease
LNKEKGNYALALDFLRKASRLRPKSAFPDYQLGHTYLLQGNPQAARGVLEEVIRKHPDFIEAHVTLATAYYRLDMKAEGDRERDIVIRLNKEKAANKGPKDIKSFQKYQPQQ